MRFRLARGLTMTLATAALLAPAAAVPATAAGLPFDPAHHPAGAVAARSIGGAVNINGSNGAGYAATGSFPSVSATWTTRSAPCKSTNDLYAPWVGLDGYS